MSLGPAEVCGRRELREEVLDRGCFFEPDELVWVSAEIRDENVDAVGEVTVRGGVYGKGAPMGADAEVVLGT